MYRKLIDNVKLKPLRFYRRASITCKLLKPVGFDMGMIFNFNERFYRHFIGAPKFNTVSDVALVGGGSNPQPGEISLAHNGVLFLDELPEFKRSVLEVLRQPLEERKVTISRARLSVDYPCSLMLIASMNPCGGENISSILENSQETVKT